MTSTLKLSRAWNKSTTFDHLQPLLGNKRIKRWDLYSCNSTMSCKQSFCCQHHQNKRNSFYRIIRKRKAALEAALTWTKNNVKNIDNTLLISRFLCELTLGKNSCINHKQPLFNNIYATLMSKKLKFDLLLIIQITHLKAMII